MQLATTHLCVHACACAWLQGNRDNINSMPAGSQRVMSQVLTMIDTYDLYGSGEGACALHAQPRPMHSLHCYCTDATLSKP
jgi:hypothetical protein